MSKLVPRQKSRGAVKLCEQKVTRHYYRSSISMGHRYDTLTCQQGHSPLSCFSFKAKPILIEQTHQLFIDNR